MNPPAVISGPWVIVLVALIGGLPATLTALAALVAALRSGRRQVEYHKAVNGRMDEVLEQTRAAAYATGILAGKNQEADATPIPDYPATGTQPQTAAQPAGSEPPPKARPGRRPHKES